ncbi:MAG: IS66 family transposase [Candidatus Pacebacteria bacterium]|jgi:transposase|nr:IS66 family transposase [Candidatus Paceibacterota bacterium]
MEQQHLFETIPADKYDLLSREELIILHKGELDLNKQLQKYNKELLDQLLSSEQKSFLLEEQTLNIKNRLFGKSSEKSSKKSNKSNNTKSSKKRVLLPSERYPNIDVIEKDVTLDEVPNCPCCTKEMQDSGLTEDSEYLTVIPKRYYIVKQKRHKYRCSSCQGALETTPAIPRIKPGSSYSDEMMLDVALTKYCDLIPVERYVQMASRTGVTGIPANSLIQGTHNVADFLEVIYERIKEEIINSKILHADETPHRMLEGDKKNHWFLWGFSTETASYFEAKDTRSGSIATKFLENSQCEYLISDAFSGYKKAVNDTNIYRKENDLREIINIFCNAHARRKFKESINNYEEESHFYLWCYQKIYHLEKKKDYKKRRDWQRVYFRVMERMALKIKNSYSSKSTLSKALNYFINNYKELTYFLNFKEIPIDNNSQERLMRSPVIGRKTWFGTHSKRGAKTNVVLFSLIESCKLNKINPREYFKEIVLAIHQNQQIFTPNEYRIMKSAEIA